MNSNFVIMGLHGSGKTTFLAALWHLVESEEEPCRLALETYDGDLEYLTLIAEAWRTFRKVPRTSQHGDVDVTIRLVDRATGARGAAFFPDLAGETFDAQVETRECRPKFLEDVADDDGILFFISADLKGNALSIVEMNAMLPDVADQDPGSGRSVGSDAVPEGGAVEDEPEWDPKTIPTQVRVVQLLSDLLRPPFEARPRRLAVIISAWDLTRGMDLRPGEWLSVHLSLVDQFLRTNGDMFESRIYGVSAQGVSLDDPDAVREAAKLGSSRRIRIISPEGSEGHDLSLPLVWLMSGERAPDR